MAMSIGHSSSAYSLLVVKPSGSVMAALTMIACQPQKLHPAQQVAEHARLAQPLQRVVDAHEHAVADEGEDHGVGVHRAQPAEGDELEVQVGRRPEQLRGDQQPRRHADQAPDRRSQSQTPARCWLSYLNVSTSAPEPPPACFALPLALSSSYSFYS